MSLHERCSSRDLFAEPDSLPAGRKFACSTLVLLRASTRIFTFGYVTLLTSTNDFACYAALVYSASPTKIVTKGHHMNLRSKLGTILVAGLWCCAASQAQTPLATVPVGANATSIGFNAQTNKIYVVGGIGNSLTEIDGYTFQNTTIALQDQRRGVLSDRRESRDQHHLRHQCGQQ
jgi:hypothetical protein